jgi:hypothetical protein
MRLVVAGMLGSLTTARAAAPPNQVALEASPLGIDWYWDGQEFVANQGTSTSVGVSFQRQLWRHLAAGAVVTYIQPGSVLLPPIPGVRFGDGRHDSHELLRSSRMVVAQARLRLVFPFADDRGEIGVAVEAGPAFLAFPGKYRGWGGAADLGVDAVWFWSRWGASLRVASGVGLTRGSQQGTGMAREIDAGIDRIVPLTLTAAVVRRF